MDHPEIIASVAVLTYNHEAFIRQCLDSILEQVVSFEYEIVVVDDCSSDSTRDILKEYADRFPKISLILNTENKGISSNNNLVLSKCNGKYVAMLEGDDYWIDPNKLQRQVDFLDGNDEYGFVGARCLELLPDGRLVEENDGRFAYEDKWLRCGDVFKNAVKGPVTRTATLCFRKSIVIPYLSMLGAGNDTVLQAILAKHSLYARWNQPTSVYRIGGVSNNHRSLRSELIYHEYFKTNRRLKHFLFPDDCPINEDNLTDRESYILLKMAIKGRDWKKAKKIKSDFKLSTTHKKAYAKYLTGPVSCYVLSLILRRYYGK